MDRLILIYRGNHANHQEFKMGNLNKEVVTYAAFIGKWDNGIGNCINPTTVGSQPLTDCMVVDFEKKSIDEVVISDDLLLASFARALWIEGGYKKSSKLQDAIDRSGRGYMTPSHESKNKEGASSSSRKVIEPLVGHVVTVLEHLTNSIKLSADNMDYAQLKAVHEFISTFTGLIPEDTQEAISRHCMEYEENLIKFDGLLSDSGFSDLVTQGKLYTVKTDYSLKECNQALSKFKFLKVDFDGEVLTFTDLK
jgi:hypothetical protein